jgi:hypothetical protein
MDAQASKHEGGDDRKAVVDQASPDRRQRPGTR